MHSIIRFTFTFMHLADAFIQSDLVHSGYTYFISMCVPWELNPQPFSLLMQCSTTEPQEQMADFETEYVFCKDKRLVLIVECLFAKVSTANAGAGLLKLCPLLWEQQLICIKATYSNTGRFCSYPKSGNFIKL